MLEKKSYFYVVIEDMKNNLTNCRYFDGHVSLQSDRKQTGGYQNRTHQWWFLKDQIPYHCRHYVHTVVENDV